MSFLKINKSLSIDQHAYQAHNSTTAVTFDGTEHILDVLDDGYIAFGIFVDLG